jgi:hypothetical protein
MTLDELRALDPREIDARVAERVMGRRRHKIRFLPCERGGVWECEVCTAMYCNPPWDREKVAAEWCGDSQYVPRYSTDPDDDFAVLRHVREAWDAGQQMRVHDVLERMFRDSVRECGFPHLAYEPGDYAMAALLVATAADDTPPARG